MVDVIAHILHHLKDRLLTVLRDLKDLNLRATDFDWVITVPAFWNPGGRNMMHEAGYMVIPNCNCKLVIGNHQRSSDMTYLHLTTLIFKPDLPLEVQLKETTDT